MEVIALSVSPESVQSINRYLSGEILGTPEILYEAASHLIVHGGKRLRPYMVLETCQMLGGSESAAMAAAGAVEMVHNFSLVHDDIMDNDDTRHGVPTTHKKYDMSLALLAGDTLFSKAFQSLSKSSLPAQIRADLLDRLAVACVDICEGQCMDIAMGTSKTMPSLALYTSMIRKKTSALFEVSCAMGAICAGASSRDLANATSFGLNLGTAFQITDDLLGVVGDTRVTKKPVGNDIREGKKSLPILMALDTATGDELNLIRNTLGNHNASPQDISGAVDVIRHLGIEDTVRNRAGSYANAARRAIGEYSGRHKDNLETLLDFVVKRSI